jgi:hypothetical protein
MGHSTIVLAGLGDLGHGLLGEVAPLGDGPFVMVSTSAAGTRPRTDASLGKLPTTLTRRLTSPVVRST